MSKDIKEEPEQAQQAQINAIPIDLNKILRQSVGKPKTKCQIQPLNFSKYEGMKITQAAQPIIWEVHEKLNEIIKRVNEI